MLSAFLYLTAENPWIDGGGFHIHIYIYRHMHIHVYTCIHIYVYVINICVYVDITHYCKAFSRPL